MDQAQRQAREEVSELSKIQQLREAKGWSRSELQQFQLALRRRGLQTRRSLSSGRWLASSGVRAAGRLLLAMALVTLALVVAKRSVLISGVRVETTGWLQPGRGVVDGCAVESALIQKLGA